MNTISPVHARRGSRLTKKEFAYQQLRGHLLDRTLLPGTRLLEIPLARELCLSRIPLREAIDQLASEGLVERLPSLGSYVRSMTPKELREIYEMREVLECYTVEKAAALITGAQVGRLDDLCREISGALSEHRRTGVWTRSLRDRLVGADAAFHETIAQAAGNEAIQREIDRLSVVARVVSYRIEFAEDETEAMARSAVEHAAILRALRSRDGAKARRLMAGHVRGAADRAILVVDAAARSAKEHARGGRHR